MEDQVISRRIAREPRKPDVKAAKIAAVILGTTRNALPKQVKKGDAVAARSNVIVFDSPSAGFARR
ncbi:hypothetical protein LH22_15260 [Pantoea rwandensis]|uniref:Uncharacterized protein n=1 Tax=Pantoea rwandensis TaxID=1076550 RepID=A0ABM5RLL4_9GAMM|nr:hypothetical protein LH22_15260 [Pantoea rwandensis]